MPVRIPARNVTGDQILASFTAGGEEQQRVAVGAPFGAIQRIVMVESEPGIAADTLVATLIHNNAGTVATGQTNIAVPAGRTFRITSINFTYHVVTATTPPWIRVRLRFNPTAAVALASPAYFSMMGVPVLNLANGAGTAWAMTDPSGILDLTAGATAGGWGLSKSAHATTPGNGAFSMTIVGYEF